MNELRIVIVCTANHKQALLCASVVDFLMTNMLFCAVDPSLQNYFVATADFFFAVIVGGVCEECSLYHYVYIFLSAGEIAYSVKLRKHLH